MENERKRTGTLVNFDLLPGLELTAQGNPVTAAQPIPYGVDHLIGFNELLTGGSTDGAGVHFYIDDYHLHLLGKFTFIPPSAVPPPECAGRRDSWRQGRQRPAAQRRAGPPPWARGSAGR